MSKGSEVGSGQDRKLNIADCQLRTETSGLRTGGSETLPKGWIYTVLGDVSTHPQYGWTCSSINNGTLKLLRTTDISDGKINWASVPFCTKEPADDEKYLLKENDILVSRAGSVGISYRITKNDLFHRTVFASYLIRFCPFIPVSFVEHYFKSHRYWQFISDSQLGIAVPNVNATKLSELPFPLPPLNEQKRIVARLDKIMPRIDAVKERLNKVPSIIKRFKQSVLTAAVTGKLTEKWRAEHPDVESAADIATKISKMIKIKNIKSIIIDDEDYPTEWVSTYFTNILSELKNGVSPRPNMAPPGTNILRISANRSGNVNLNDVRYLPNGNVKYAEWLLKEKDLLFTRYNGNIDLVGVCGQVKDIQGHFLYPDKLIRVRLKDGISIPSYIEIVFQSKKLRDYVISKSKSSAGQNGLSGKDLKESVVPIPPLEEQKEIVRQVDKLFALADRLESHYQKAKARVDNLSQSVLAKAFRGELVITEAELAPKEGRDFESAEKLLERILEEKAKLVGSRQRAVRGVRSARGSKRKQKETGGKKI